MKLLSITNRYNLISILLFFAFAGIILFRLIRYRLNEELNEQLYTEQIHVSRTIQSLDSIANSSLLLNDNMSVEKNATPRYIKPELFDTVIFDNVEQEEIPYRIIGFSVQAKKANYNITIKKSQIEASDLAYSIFISLMMVFGLFSLMMILTNYYFNKKLWAPFLKTIAAMKILNINDQNTVFTAPETQINEFAELNSALFQMIERIKDDYSRIKEFSENAAHELQTPLSVITTKLESILQIKDLNKGSAVLIHQAMQYTARLSKLIQSLLLLTKIENNQFNERQPVLFSSVFAKYLELYNEIMLEKNLRKELSIKEDFTFEIHPVLADILVSNLVNNAIIHNIQNGFVRISLQATEIEIINTGEVPRFPVELLFSRFKKGNQSSTHLGLGLALVKEIVETNKLRVSYIFKDGLHIIKIEKTGD